MSKIKIELPTLILGTVIFYILGWIINGFVLEPLQSEHIVSYGSLVKDESNVLIDVLAYVPVAIILTYIFSRYIVSLTIDKGAVLGALTLSMFNLSNSMVMFSEWNLIDIFVLITDFIGMAVIGAIGGAAITFSLIKLKK